MPKISVQNGKGIIDDLNYMESRDIGSKIETEHTFKGNRVIFEPTKYALDVLVKAYGASAFGAGCRFAWAHLYKKPKIKDTEFSFVTDPYQHQREWFNKVKDKPYFAFEWEMGLGKTKIILDISRYLYAKKEMDALLVITKNGVHHKWVHQEVRIHFPEAKGCAWNLGIKDCGMNYEGTHITAVDGFVVASINFESARTKKGRDFCNRFLRQRDAGICIDESQCIKTPTSSITKACLRYAKKAVRRWILTGTMSTGSTEDAWAQYKFLDESIMPQKIESFREQYTVRQPVGNLDYWAWETDPKTKKRYRVKRPVLQVVGYKNVEKLAAHLDPYRSRLLKTECVNLPPKLYRLRSFEMSKQQKRIYAEMAEEFCAELGDDTMTATMAITKLLRLHQIACGYFVPDDADPTDDTIPGTPIDGATGRMESFMDELSKTEGPVIIWSCFRYTLQQIVENIKNVYGDDFVEYHGGIVDKDKISNLKSFHNNEVRFFIGNPQSGGTGIDLVQADKMFYYNNSYNLADRLQSEDRFHRIGQKSTSCTITDFEAIGSVDRLQLQSLKAKKDIAALLSGDDLTDWLQSSIKGK